MIYIKKADMIILSFLSWLMIPILPICAGIPLYWWEPENQMTNFGDTLSIVLIERMMGKEIKKAALSEHKLLAIGSILQFAKNGDVVWGSGINGKHGATKDYPFNHLDIRCVRGPLTRLFLKIHGIDAPKIYGDPALLFPLFFPEFKKNPIRDFLVIPHISEMHLFRQGPNVVFPTEPWNVIIQKIVESKFVISSSLHGIIVAEAFNIPSRFLRVTENEPLFKYADYYFGTGRPNYKYARSVSEALKMKGEPLPVCDLQKILSAFPRELL